MNVSISRNGTELGEWPEEQVRALYKEGQLLPTDHYWKEGMTEWVELSKMIKPAPPIAKSTPKSSLNSSKGIGRLPYIGINLSTTIVLLMFAKIVDSNTTMTFICLQLVVIMQIAVFYRFVNIGHSGWLSLFALMPILTPFINLYCLLAPTNYVIHKKRDAAMDIGIVMLIFLALLVVTLLVFHWLGTR